MESTRENRVWHAGPPPHVGWWNASVHLYLNMWRWWNGSTWSVVLRHDSITQEISYCPKDQTAGIMWNDYWPADARVPRLAPEDFEIGARWVLTRTEPVGFKGQEFTVRSWDTHGLDLHARGLGVFINSGELPSERFVPRRCIGPQTRWDFPALSAPAVEVNPSVTGLKYSDRQCDTAGDVLKALDRKAYTQAQLAQLALPNPQEVAHARGLAAQGYRRISNAYGIVARIDRPDWVDVLAKSLHRAPADFYIPGQSEPAGNWCDHYRRGYSQDKQTVDKAVAKLVPTSGHDNVGYVPPFKAEIR